MTYRDFLDASEALLAEGYQSLPSGNLLTAIEETKQWSVAGKRDEPEAATPAGGNPVQEFDEMLRGVG